MKIESNFDAKQLAANVIGIGPNRMAVYSGYDDFIAAVSDDGPYRPDENVGGPTASELIELADIMIARWTALRERLKGDVE